MTLNTWIAFLIASCLISISPGPGAISCMSAGMRYGWVKAVWNIIGLITALAVITAIIGAGVGALLIASSTAFTVLKWIGAAYLVYLGAQQWRAPAQPLAAIRDERADARPHELFMRGFFVNITNPKGVAFLLAVLPQFIDPSRPLLIQYVLCGITLALIDFLIMNIYTGIASRMLHWLRNERYIRWMNRVFGGLFIGAGALLVTFKRTT